MTASLGLGQDTERVWAIENWGSSGRPLAQYLVRCGEVVHEVSLKITARRRRRSSTPQKSDPNDALAIGRAYLMDRSVLPRVTAEAVNQELAILDEHRDNLMAERTRLINQMQQHLMQLEPEKQFWRGDLQKKETLEGCKDYQPPAGDPMASARSLVIRQLAEHILQINQPLDALKKELTLRIEKTETPLRSLQGITVITAAKMLGCIGEIQRFASSARLASYAGIAPFEMSSGGHGHHRVNRGGDRQLNRAFHILALAQKRWNSKAQAYYERKRAEGKTKKEAMRCLKRRLVDIGYAMLKNNEATREKKKPLERFSA